MNPNPNPNEQDPTIPAGPNFNPYAPGQGSNPNYSPYPGQNPSTAYGSGQGSNPNYNPYPSNTPNQGQGSNPNYNPYAPTQPGQGSNPPYDPYAPPPGQAPTPSYSPYAPPPQVPPQVPPTPAPSRPSGGRRIALIVVATIVILAGIIAAVAGVAIHNNQVANDNATATANAQGTAQVIAQAHTTATAQAVATANILATATAVATSHYPPFTHVALNDSLTSSSSDWTPSSICQFSSSGFQVSIVQVNTIQYCLNSGQFGELAYQVTMSITQGDCGGLIFRRVDNNNFFFFEVCANGNYNLGDYVNNNESSLGFHASSAIRQGLNQQNVIAVTVQGNTVNMYVNGKNIDTATSQALTSSIFSQGAIGLLAADLGDPTTIIYTNALVWTIS